MSDASASKPRSPLRRDLSSVPVAGQHRAYRIVIDEIGGQFARVREHIWQSIQNGVGDESLWQEAKAAGWTRHRVKKRRKFSPLYFRVPILSIDGIASALASISSLVFSVPAVLAWSVVIALAAVMAISHGTELMASFGSLETFLQQSNPVWLGIIFVGTKVVHELAHAVMCRRMGGRCGNIGILLLCGMPCPYCDVTDIWRQPSSARRAAVMMAGIYVELIIAALATLVWVAATDPAIQLSAINLMVVCGMSTLIFNANPLMRYDGYYVLGDFIASTNLRQEANDAFRAVVTQRVAGEEYLRAQRSDRRAILLSCYHAASLIYRVVILTAIAALIIRITGFFHLESLGTFMVVVAITMIGFRLLKNAASIAVGKDRWFHVPTWRRSVVVGIPVLLLVTILFTPLPRYRSASGQVDAAQTSAIFLSSTGSIKDVSADFGKIVGPGDPLVKVENESLAIEHAKLRGQLRVARLRGNLSRSISIDRAELAQQWKTLQAAEDAVSAQLASVEKRNKETLVVAPIGGVVLPVLKAKKPSKLPPTDPRRTTRNLQDRVGMSAQVYDAWCQISPTGALEAALIIDARDRVNIDIGTPVRISLSQAPEQIYHTKVSSVSAIEDDNRSIIRQSAYQVLCPLPAVNQNQILPWIGKECKGVFHLPRRTLAEDATRWLGEWLSG